MRLDASLARGFRGPSMKELGWTFANIAAGYVIQGNPDLRPERSWDLSTGVSWSPVRGWLATAEVFRNEMTDLIDFAAVGTNETGAAVYTPRNVADARAEGGEAAVRGIHGRWGAEVGYAYLHAADLTTGLPLESAAGRMARSDRPPRVCRPDHAGGAVTAGENGG